MITKQVKLPRIGLYTTGLKAYWDQFENLKERLLGYNAFIEGKLSQYAEVHNFGLVDNEITGAQAGEWFNTKNVDMILLHEGTYCTSSCILPIHQICKAPILILNLQPTSAMNYAKTSTGEWLAHCIACAGPEICNAFNRANIPYHLVSGLLGLHKTPEVSITDEVTNQRPEAKRAWKEIGEWIQAVSVKRNLQSSRFGFLGNNYSGMLDMYSDFTMMQAQSGIHVEILEMCDLDKELRDVTSNEIAEKTSQIHEFFEISGDSPSDPIAKKPTSDQMQWAATIAAAQERMVRKYQLDALAYYYHGRENRYEEIQSGFIVGHSLLTANGIPCAGEGDIKTALAMKICDLVNTGGSFCEIVATDYDRGTIIFGHDGPFHISISDGKPILRGMGVYHGKRGSGVSVEANVKPGDVTLLGVSQTIDGKLKIIISEGIAIKDQILMIGNTQTHVRFRTDPDTYMERWFIEAPIHHLAMSVGHNAALFAKVAQLLDIHYIIL